VPSPRLDASKRESREKVYAEPLLHRFASSRRI
jgi:hypothetical protein